MTILLATDRLPASLCDEVLAACDLMQLTTATWPSEVPLQPSVFVSVLAAGERRIPQDAIALLQAHPAMHVILCASEPLIKSRVMIGDGRVSVLSPPIDRGQLVIALRGALAPATVAPAETHFEALRRTHWTAWSQGTSGPPICNDADGATLLVGEHGRDITAISRALNAVRTEAEGTAAISTLAGSAGVIHLTQDARTWMIYWPNPHMSLWLYSPSRLPMHWNIATAIEPGKIMRLPAMPSDQIFGVWSEHDTTGPATEAQRAAIDGGTETLRALQAINNDRPHCTGWVVEIRA